MKMTRHVIEASPQHHSSLSHSREHEPAGDQDRLGGRSPGMIAEVTNERR